MGEVLRIEKETGKGNGGFTLGDQQVENYHCDATPLRPSPPLSGLSGRLSQRESDFTLPLGGSSEARGGENSVSRSPNKNLIVPKTECAVVLETLQNEKGQARALHFRDVQFA